MSLATAQMETLRHVCRTLIPTADDTLPAGIVAALATTGQPKDLQELGQALTLLEYGSLLNGQFGRFSRLDTAARTAVLNRWANHPLPLLRKAFQALKRLAAFLWYSSPSSGLWPEIGYPGVDERPAVAPALQVTHLDASMPAVFEADVVVIGSGAGGGVAAAVLAERGLRVIVLEKGGYYPESELGMPEFEGFQKLYLDRGMCATQDLSVAILAGATVGGGTTVNWSAALAPPAWLREEWETVYGLQGLTSTAFQDCVDEVMQRLHVQADCSTAPAGTSADRLLAGCRALGYQAGELPRNERGCGDDCGFCTFGCRLGGKQSTPRTYLADATAFGAQVIPQADVGRVLIENGRVQGVAATIAGRPVTVRAPRVVLAAGAIGSPAILLRSGLANPNIGRHLHLHPVLAVSAVYPGGRPPWQGRLLSAYSHQFARLQGNYGFLLEVAPAHPGQLAMFTPWQSGTQFTGLLQDLGRVGVLLVLARDKGSGRVTVDRAGRHRIDYRVSAFDRAHLLRGQHEAIRIHAAAGAQRIFTTHTRPNVLDAVTPASAAAFATASAQLPAGPNQVAYFSAHQMGTCRLGRSPQVAVADSQGQVFGAQGLYVADGSGFPAASGVNPMITIMSLARWVAKQIP